MFQLLSPSKYITVLFLIITTSALAVVLIAKFKIDHFYAKSPRMIDPRLFKTEDIPDVITYFINRKTLEHTRFKILMIGNSQTFGALYRTELTFSSKIEHQIGKGTVLNLAFNDQKILDNIYLLTLLKKKKVSARVALISVHAGDTKQPDFQHINTMGMSPLGLRNLLFPKVILSGLSEERNYKNPSEYSNQALGKYFEDLMNVKYQNHVDTLIETALTVADEVFLYINPHPTRGVEYLGYTWKDLEGFRKMVEKKCQTHGVHCLKVQSIFEDNDFFDIVHFTQRGHDKMAELVYQAIKPALQVNEK